MSNVRTVRKEHAEMGGREIITLQFGKEANFVGTHLWNFQRQDSDPKNSHRHIIDSAVDAKVTERHGQPFYSPRTLAIDLQESLGGVSLATSSESPHGQEVPTWHNSVEVHRAPAVHAAAFRSQIAEDQSWQRDGQRGSLASETFEQLAESARALEQPDTVKFWTDYLAADLGPGNVWQLPGIWEASGALRGFGSARCRLADGDLLEEFQERVRVLAEECDLLQGFRVLIDDRSGFGSLAAAALPLLRDDFANAPVLALPVRHLLPSQADDPRLRRLSDCLSLAQIAPAVSLYCPLAAPPELPHAQWLQGSRFHTSAVCAVLTHQATLPTRLQRGAGGGCDLRSLVQLLGEPSPVVAAGLSFPCPMPADSCPAARHRGPPFTEQDTVSCTPGLSYQDWWGGLRAESVVLRGAPAAALDAALQAEGRSAVRHRCALARPMDLPLPFPRLSSGGSSGQPGVPAVAAVLSRLGSSVAARGLAQRSAAAYKGLESSALGRRLLDTWGYDGGEREEMKEGLHALGSAYEEDLEC